MTTSRWSYSDSPVRVAAVKLACGHTIEASEYDGGMDELPVISRSMLEATVSRRVVTHAVGGCDEPAQAGVLHHRHTVSGPDTGGVSFFINIELIALRGTIA